MQSLLLFLSVFGLCAHAEQFKIPQVEAVVKHALAEFSETVHYAGNESHTLAARQATPYWYEQIAHQGISAYGPSGYKVYRNVKDYGAKGMNCFGCLLAIY